MLRQRDLGALAQQVEMRASEFDEQGLSTTMRLESLSFL